MVRTACTILSLLLVTGACASAPAPVPSAAAAPAAFNPVGAYDFTTIVDGQTINGLITIGRGDTGELNASVATSATGTMNVQSVTQEGERVTLRGNTSEGALSMVLDFRGEELTGTWGLGALSGTLTGRRRQ